MSEEKIMEPITEETIRDVIKNYMKYNVYLGILKRLKPELDYDNEFNTFTKAGCVKEISERINYKIEAEVEKQLSEFVKQGKLKEYRYDNRYDNYTINPSDDDKNKMDKVINRFKNPIEVKMYGGEIITTEMSEDEREMIYGHYPPDIMINDEDFKEFKLLLGAMSYIRRSLYGKILWSGLVYSLINHNIMTIGDQHILDRVINNNTDYVKITKKQSNKNPMSFNEYALTDKGIARLDMIETEKENFIKFLKEQGEVSG